MLIGTKICLGPMFHADAPILFNWRNTVDLMHMDGLYRPVSQSSFDQWFSGIGKEPTRVVFSIRQQGDLKLLGFVQIVNLHPVFRTAELGIMIGDDVNRGKGYGQEALRLCVQFCWNELNLQRLSVLVIGDNPRAFHTYQKVGFEREGVLRRAYYVDGAYRDVPQMGLLR